MADHVKLGDERDKMPSSSEDSHYIYIEMNANMSELLTFPYT